MAAANPPPAPCVSALLAAAWRGDEFLSKPDADAVAELRVILKEAAGGAVDLAAIADTDIVAAAEIVLSLPERKLVVDAAAPDFLTSLRAESKKLLSEANAAALGDAAALDDIAFAIAEPALFASSVKQRLVVAAADALAALPADPLAGFAADPLDSLAAEATEEEKAAANAAHDEHVASKAAATAAHDEAKAAATQAASNAVSAYDDALKAVAAAPDTVDTVKPKRDELTKARDDLKELKDKRAAEEEEAKKVPPPPEVRSTAGVPYADLLTARNSALVKIDLLHAVFKDVTENGRQVTKFVTQFANAWDDEIKQLQAQADDVDAQSKALIDQPPRLLPNEDLQVKEVAEQLAKLKELRGAVESSVKADKEAQAAFDEKLVEFNRERQRLLLWCRQEKSNLDGTTDVDAVQEFCATLLNHTPAMESNLTVLLEMAEPLLPSPVVQAALLESNEVWLNLHISAYERLRRTLLEVHERAKLEDEVRAYSGYAASAAEFLDALLKLLGAPSTEKSQSLVADVVETARSLRADLSANHAHLSTQLRDFALRMEGFRDNYGNLRRAVFARLTYLASAVPTLSASARRKEEYSQRMQSLQRWVQAKSRGESWSEIKTRVEKLRKMVSDEKAAMANEAPLSAAVTDPVA